MHFYLLCKKTSKPSHSEILLASFTCHQNQINTLSLLCLLCNNIAGIYNCGVFAKQITKLKSWLKKKKEKVENMGIFI